MSLPEIKMIIKTLFYNFGKTLMNKRKYGKTRKCESDYI